LVYPEGGSGSVKLVLSVTTTFAGSITNFAELYFGYILALVSVFATRTGKENPNLLLDNIVLGLFKNNLDDSIDAVFPSEYPAPAIAVLLVMSFHNTFPLLL
jgi:hypothetical protein